MSLAALQESLGNVNRYLTASNAERWSRQVSMGFTAAEIAFVVGETVFINHDNHRYKLPHLNRRELEEVKTYLEGLIKISPEKTKTS